MLVVNAPLLTDKVKNVLDGYDKDGITIKFRAQKGMRLEFDITGIDGYDAVSLAKHIVRKNDWGNALYFSASVEKEK